MSTKDYEQTYNDHWKELVENPDGTLNKDSVMRELHDFSFLQDQAARVYCHVTGDRLSKLSYFASSVIAVADEVTDIECANAVEDFKAESDEEWTAMGEDDDGEWIAALTEYTRESAEAYVKAHGGYVVRRYVTDWEKP